MLKLTRLLYCLFCALIVMLIISCSRVSQDNFNKIKPDMTMEQVIQILGEPTKSDGVNFLGISGTAATWEDKNSEINIQFLNDRVISKAFIKERNTKNDEK